MDGGNFQIYSVQITGKCVFWISPSPPPHLHDLIISPHVKYPPINLPPKIYSTRQSFLRKKSRHTLGKGEETLCFILYLFQFLKASSITFVVKTVAFQVKSPKHCVIKVIQYD